MLLRAVNADLKSDRSLCTSRDCYSLLQPRCGATLAVPAAEIKFKKERHVHIWFSLPKLQRDNISHLPLVLWGCPPEKIRASVILVNAQLQATSNYEPCLSRAKRKWHDAVYRARKSTGGGGGRMGQQITGRFMGRENVCFLFPTNRLAVCFGFSIASADIYRAGG